MNQDIRIPISLQAPALDPTKLIWLNGNPAIDISNTNGNQDLWNAATPHRDESPASVPINANANK